MAYPVGEIPDERPTCWPVEQNDMFVDATGEARLTVTEALVGLELRDAPYIVALRPVELETTIPPAPFGGVNWAVKIVGC